MASQPAVLITGCSSGIGHASARLLHARGWQVVASCRKQADVDRLRGEGLASVRLDYEEASSITSGFEAALEITGGRLDALFNNGAYAIPGCVEDLPTDGLRQIFEANLFGWHELTRRAIPVMRAQGYGRIVQNSSVLGLIALKYRGAYNATKFALEGLSDTLRLELAGTGIQVSTIEPGPIATRFRRNAKPQFERWIDWENAPNRALYEQRMIPRLNAEDGESQPFELPPEAVARKLVHALEARRAKPRYYVTTPTYALGGLKRLLSTRWLDRVAAAASN
ncbi:SDR family NAD(P)-dependent oxidoreductase [Rhodovibrio salinarum]|uniref:Short-chain dehydrogenase/reductase n=1 Tax=Rhodovibrio salinarum TaxID=1087 RepID=A0A934QKC0_9PROT|nr:SDR family NAD(P)-dependent oxidoreductase [Rhodovibrio salinarum]MBK1698431.1 short-chain dehydrogenase/reductase [Rhodovibrio salinarum]